MLSKKKFLETVDQLLSRNNLNDGEKDRFKNIKKNETQLPEEITAEILIEKLDLIDINTITNEEGYYKEFVNTIDNDIEDNQTEIFYLLKGKQVSCLHILKTTEKWNWIAGNAISLFIEKGKELTEITLNEGSQSFTIEKDTIFGAKITTPENNDFVLVTCLCIPGFKKEHYINPTSEQIDELYNYNQKNKTIIDALTKNSCSAKKTEEQTPLTNSPQNNSR